MILRLAITFILFGALSLYAQMQTRQKVMMGTYVSISVDAKDKALIEPAFLCIKEVENSLSSYMPNTPIYKLNQKKHAKLDPYSYEALVLAKRYYQESDGYFDIAVGHITKDLFRFGLSERNVSKNMLQKSSLNINALTFDKDKAKISNKIKIDLGGMGKGFAVDKVYDFLKTNHVQKAVIALSGDIRCIGECRIEVRNPFSQESMLASFRMQESGVSTSGNYNRYIGTPKNNHLINPKLKMPQQEFVSVTLISKLPSVTLDAYATAASVMPKEKALAFLQKHTLAYILLTSKNELLVSKNLEQFTQNLFVQDAFQEKSKE